MIYTVKFKHPLEKWVRFQPDHHTFVEGKIIAHRAEWIGNPGGPMVLNVILASGRQYVVTDDMVEL